MPIATHTTFSVDGTTYMLSSFCPQAQWPVLVGKIHKIVERIGKKVAAEFENTQATVICSTSINKIAVEYCITINPKGLEHAFRPN